MAKISALLTKKNVSGDFGVEIEAEGLRLPYVDGDKWTMEVDHSLRGNFPKSCCEYVLPAPVSMAVANERIKHLIKRGVEEETTWKFSFRTSVHVHLNVLDMEEDALKALIYTYILIEEVMHNYCGKERKHNRFCLRLQDAEHTIEPLVNLMKYGVQVFGGNYHENSIRYAALNLASIKKYGSLEFRGMRGTLDQGVLKNWMGAIYSLRAYANKIGSVKEVYNDFFNSTPEDFLNRVLGEYAEVFKFPGYEDTMRLAYSISIEIPMACIEKKKKPLASKADLYERIMAVNPFDVPPPAPRVRPYPARRPAVVFHDDVVNLAHE